jgi:hypothetical protein
MIVNTSFPRDRLTYAAENGQPHLRYIITTVRDHGVSLCLVPQGKSPFEPMHDRPAIVLIGNDMLEAVTLRNPESDPTAASLWAIANCKLAFPTAARNKSLSLLRIRRLPRVERLAELT